MVFEPCSLSPSPCPPLMKDCPVPVLLSHLELLPCDWVFVQPQLLVVQFAALLVAQNGISFIDSFELVNGRGRGAFVGVQRLGQVIEGAFQLFLRDVRRYSEGFIVALIFQFAHFDARGGIAVTAFVSVAQTPYKDDVTRLCDS